MTYFSATDAAFEGFRLARHHPKAVGLWALAALVFNLSMMTVLIAMAGPALADMVAMNRTGAVPDTAESMAAIGTMVVAYMALLPLMFLFLAIFAGAIYRASSRPGAGAWGFLRLGPDELRLLVVSVVVGLMGLVTVMVISIVVAIVGSIIGVALSGGQPNAVAMVVTVLLLYVGMFFGGMAFYVKFSFAGPMTFLKQKIDIFGSWKATSGRFWALFGCYTLAVVLGMVVTLLGMAIGMAAMLAFGGAVDQMLSPDMSSLASYFTPGMLAYVAVTSVFTALTYAIYQGPAMAAYRAIHGAGDVSQAFD